VDYSLEKTPRRSRITFLGDSFTAGHGIKNVDDRFVNILRKNRENRQEVHALATNGFDSGHEMKVLHQFFRKGYQTDTVVLVYVLNDVSDLIPEWQAILGRFYKEHEKEGFLVRNSYFINKLYYQIEAGRDPGFSRYYSFLREGHSGATWEEQKQRLRDIKEFCQSRQIRFLAVTFPLLQAMGPDYSYADIHQMLGAFWADQGVPHLDLAPVYRSRPARELVVGKHDAHPNELAHKKAAEAIDVFLEREMK
jgi:hypothetical protein